MYDVGNVSVGTRYLIPDFWALMANGSMRFYPGGRTSHGTPVEVVADSDSDFGSRRAMG